MIHAYSCDPSYYQKSLNELINHFGDRTIVVNGFINKLEIWHVKNQNKQSVMAFSFFEETRSGISIPWFYSRPSINNAIEKRQRKDSTQPHFEVDRELSHRVPLTPISCRIPTVIRASSPNL